MTGITSAGRRVRGLDADQRREQRRDQLLATTLDLLAEKGYQNVSIEQICQTAYVSTKSFYELFDSKEACYLTLLQQLSEQIEAQMQEVLRAGPAGLDDLVAAFAHALVDDPRTARVTFGEASGVSRAVEQQRRVNRRWSASFLETAWRAYDVVPPRRRGPRVDLHRIAIGAIGGLFDMVADWLHDSDPADPEHVAALIADLTAFHRIVCAGITVG
jgi:AcrR family transcriptional regulator